jgi:hypothetical protein
MRQKGMKFQRQFTEKAYEHSLARHHPYPTRKVVSFALGLIPGRNGTKEKLCPGMTNQEMMFNLNLMVSYGLPVTIIYISIT